jgi:hypothetical protein
MGLRLKETMNENEGNDLQSELKSTVAFAIYIYNLFPIQVSDFMQQDGSAICVFNLIPIVSLFKNNINQFTIQDTNANINSIV